MMRRTPRIARPECVRPASLASHPWLIPADGFDEGVDLDSVLPAIQLVLAAVSGRLWWLARSERAEESSPRRRLRAAA